jgi:hypothetical protein
MSMLGLVLATNIFQMYLFWELVGVSSYLLIGFYYPLKAAVAASKKAFIVTRFADLFFLIGILIFGYYTQSFSFSFAGDIVAGDGIAPLITADATKAMAAGAFILPTALVLMFPPRTPDEKYVMLPFFWIPEDTIPIRVRRASVPYDVWYKQGYLNATEGNVIHYGFIEQFIEDLGTQYHILEIAFDRWGAVQMTQDLEGMGFTVVPFGQGYKDMSPPTKEFYKLLMEGRIIHGGNPVMRWMSGNVVVDTDPAGNIKCTKAKSPEKIDGIVAAIMALDRCIRHEQQGSVYDERGLYVF